MIIKIIDVRDSGNSIKIYAQASVGFELINTKDTVISGEPCQEFTFIVQEDESLDNFSEKSLHYITERFTEMQKEKDKGNKRVEILRGLKKTLVGTVIEIKGQ